MDREKVASCILTICLTLLVALALGYGRINVFTPHGLATILAVSTVGGLILFHLALQHHGVYTMMGF